MKTFWQKFKSTLASAGRRVKTFFVAIFKRCKTFLVAKLGKNSPLQIKARRLLRATFAKTTHDRVLEKAYIGKNYDKITRRRFNIPGFFLSSLYMFYRRMYVSGLIVFALNITLIVLTHNLVPHSAPNITVDIFHQILIGLLVGFLVNKYYGWVVARRVMRIKAKYPGKSRLELKGICEVLGGTKIRTALPATLLEVVITIVMFLVFAVQYVVERISGTAVRIETTVEEATEEVQTVLHAEVPPILNDIVQNLFGEKNQK